MLKQDDTSYFNNTRSELINLVPYESRKILDVGCNDGSFGKLVKDKNDAEVWGVELNKTAGEIAETRLDKVLIGDVNNLLQEIPNGYFDCICFNDVIEHLIDPWEMLKRVKKKLTNNGRIICSIPNIRHYTVINNLVFKGEWKYQTTGIMDYTHLRFFTKKSIIEMFKDLKYDVLFFDGIHPTTSIKFNILNMLCLNSLKESRYLQFVCVVKPLSGTKK